ncbi:DnaJ domain-containing protein [bacterium]|nr:DnaJ domain-containing protein [candidate division CSSED10-310 bacterium]
MTQKGSLAKIEFGKLITWINNQKLSGTLRLTRWSKSKFVLFENGDVASAYSEFTEDSFRSVIRRMMLLPESQQLELDLEPDATDVQFAKHLIEKGYVTEREFLEVLKQQNQDILLSLFEWRKGDFVFYQDKFPEARSITFKIPFKWIIEKGTERYRQRMDIDSRLPLKAVFRVRNADFRKTQVAEHPQPEVRRLFDCLSDPRTIKDIIEETGLTEFDAVSILLRFLERGHIEPMAEEAMEVSQDVRKLMADSEIYYSKGRYWEAWTRLRKALVEAPSHPELQKLYRQYTLDFKEDLRKTISSMQLVPTIVGTIDNTVYQKFPKDTALGFFISRIDGNLSVAELGQLLQVDREKLLITLYVLVQGKLVELKPKKGPVPQEIAERRKFVRQLWEKIQDQSYYEMLGLDQTASDAEVKNAYFKMAKQYHPDARSEDDPQEIRERLDEIFNKIRAAYRTLIDAEKRKNYDEQLGMASGEEDRAKLKTRTKAQLQFSVGLKSLQSREYRTAMEYFRSAIDLDPYEPKYYGKLAEVCTKNPRWYRAGILSCIKAIQLNPEDSIHYSILGTLYKLDGNFIEAEKQFIKVLQLEPENITAKQELKAMGKPLPKGVDQLRESTQFTPMIRKKKNEQNE